MNEKDKLLCQAPGQPTRLLAWLDFTVEVKNRVLYQVPGRFDIYADLARLYSTACLEVFLDLL